MDLAIVFMCLYVFVILFRRMQNVLTCLVRKYNSFNTLNQDIVRERNKDNKNPYK